MGANNVWEFKLKSTVHGQECLNVFFYRGNAATTPDASQMAASFEDQILPDIQAIVSDDVTFNGLEVRDILAEDTPYFLFLDVDGLNSSVDTLPSSNAFGMLMNVATNLTRPGHKRFPGIWESIVTEGVITDAGAIASLNTLATTLADSLFDTATGLIAWAAPVIVKRILEGEVYRLPETLAELVTNAVIDVVPSLLVTSQVSRKVRAD